jgi:D-glutamate cyclase
VAIATGFCIVDAEPPTAETDGPPGALFLASSLAALGVEVVLLTDKYGMDALEVGCDHYGLARSIIREFPLEETGTTGSGASTSSNPTECPLADRWIEQFLSDGPGARLTHLISIERVGPSHTPRSFLAQRRAAPTSLEEFERDVPAASRNVCHNMRGVPIDAYTGRIHRLFEAVAERYLPVTTIGIGDGGNEIGMGTIPWELLRGAITVGPAGIVACRVATDFTVLGGISDWAAYALAFALCRLRGESSAAAANDEQAVRVLIEALVRDAGAVDGVTGRHEPSVDGLPLETYLQVFAGIRDLFASGAR